MVSNVACGTTMLVEYWRVILYRRMTGTRFLQYIGDSDLNQKIVNYLYIKYIHKYMKMIILLIMIRYFPTLLNEKGQIFLSSTHSTNVKIFSNLYLCDTHLVKYFQVFI